MARITRPRGPCYTTTCRVGNWRTRYAWNRVYTTRVSTQRVEPFWLDCTTPDAMFNFWSPSRVQESHIEHIGKIRRRKGVTENDARNVGQMKWSFSSNGQDLAVA